MFNNKVKEKLARKKLVIGSWIGLPSIELVEIMCSVGFDFLVIDLEHSTIDIDTAKKMMMIMEANGIPPFIRVGNNSPYLIKLALDAGCYGIIVPDIRNIDDAISAINSCFYQPYGTRGTGLSRAQRYGSKFNEYLDWYTENLCIILQIEHFEAVKNLRDILGLERVDATMIGPYDLSSSLGRPGEFRDDKFKSEIKKYENASDEMKKPKGYHVVVPDQLSLEEKVNKGYTFLVYGVDHVIFSRQCDNIRKEIDKW